MTWHYPPHSLACGILVESTCRACLLLWPGTERWSDKRVCKDCDGMGFLPGELNGRCERCGGRGEIPEVPEQVRQDVERRR